MRQFPLAVLLTLGLAQASSVFYSVNGTDAPGSNHVVNIWTCCTDVGWYVTPTASFDLTEVDTVFGSVDSRTVTVVIFSGGPAGTLLGHAGFTPQTSLAGGVFTTPIPIVAGQSYFVGFENVNGLGVNITADAGAQSVGDLFYDVAGNGSFSMEYTVVDENRQPILQFLGTAPLAVPEPHAVVLMTAGLGLVALLRRQKRSGC